MIHIHEMINGLNESANAVSAHVDFLVNKPDLNSSELAGFHHMQHASLSQVSSSTNAVVSNGSINLFTPGFGAGVGAGCAMLGATGVGIGQGYTAGEAVEGLARNPKMESKIRMTMLIGAAIAESSAIYALIISILLIFVAPNLIK